MNMNDHPVHNDSNFLAARCPAGWLWLWAVVGLMLPLVGCGGDNYAPVSGVVQLNGEPLADAKLVFEPIGDTAGKTGGSPSYGRTDADGRYSLHSPVADRPGAALGQHRVRIITASAPEYTEAQMTAARETLRKQEQEGGDPNAEITDEQVRNYLSDTVLPTFDEKLPARYNSATELTFEVEPGGTTEANFALESP
jgi:hypothetical protein